MKLYMNVYQVKFMCCVQCFYAMAIDCVLCLFCIIHILIHAITHSEFSQDDVLGTRMNFLLSTFESDAPNVLENVLIFCCWRSSILHIM